jgi:hypothetical protein
MNTSEIYAEALKARRLAQLELVKLQNECNHRIQDAELKVHQALIAVEFAAEKHFGIPGTQVGINR